ncbi:hypothetical protein [Mycolicibacterium mageritense]|uniref:hypothetical protein n=1 Tax=Mycolicibacterium mageritense TaxID=53462 RepID=UPI001E321C4C|nr:hypothetical protein [Mycolicibacterium mageritense]MCC9184365.1 hypothetical protein [Mycolicibacterium mageritense]
MAEATVDRFDDMRRAWISAHQGESTIQRRRAEILGKQIRARQRAAVVAVPDPHDDTVLPRIFLRAFRSTASRIELVFVLALLFIAPAGWLGGWILKSSITRLIPQTLRSFPIVALLSSGALLGMVVVWLYDPAPGSTLTQIVVVPWVCVQIPAAATIAGLYGIAEGWLAVPGSVQWWPLTPPRPPLTPQDAAQVLGGLDITPPVPVHTKRLNETGQRSRP